MRMIKKISLLIFWFFLITINDAINPQCTDTEFEPNGTYKHNTRQILSSLASSNLMDRGGFYTTSIGKDSDKVYAMGMCTTKTAKRACSECIIAATEELMSCPNQVEAYTWRATPNALCFARYSNRSFLGKPDLEIDMHPLYSEFNSRDIKTNKNVTDFLSMWNRFIAGMVDETSKEKSTSLSNRKHYAVDQLELTNFQTVYALMQCTPDLPSHLCRACLQKSVREHEERRGMLGGIIAWPICYFRWDMQPFSGAFDSGIPCDKKIPTVVFISVVVPAAVICFLLSAAMVVLCRLRKPQPTPDPPIILPINSLQYDLKTIEDATCTFSKSNMLGQGGFGEVFKGVLPDGSDIAVKRLSKESAQGVQEFKNETSLVAKLQHRNLVRVLGFCQEGEEKILIYEFVPNKSLDYYLFEPTKQGQLDWRRRYGIIVGTAKGILYLHQDAPLKIIHRDLKASNIILDADMKPKVADFGMARILGMDQSRADTRRVVGTYGYIAPEYMMRGEFSTKSDVYSFGVIILEIISGKKNSNFHETDESGKTLITHAWRHWKDGTPLELVDAELGGNYQSDEVIKCIHIALLCVQNEPEKRLPLSEIIPVLTSNSNSLPLPQSPPYEVLEFDLPPINSVHASVNDSLMSDFIPR